MRVSEIEQFFEKNRWNVGVGKNSELVGTVAGASGSCGDGRYSQETGHLVTRGPNVFGGLAGLADLIAMTRHSWLATNKHLEMALELMDKSGFAPAMHDIGEGKKVHCGQQIVVAQGGVFPRQIFSAQKARDLALSRGGKHLHLLNKHVENRLGINLDPYATREPDDTEFHVDLGWLITMGISPKVALMTSMLTVERLSGVRSVVIYQ